MPKEADREGSFPRLLDLLRQRVACKASHFAVEMNKAVVCQKGIAGGGMLDDALCFSSSEVLL